MSRVLVFMLVFFLGFNLGHSQKSVNDYKYVIVPAKYDFLGEEDKYRLNSLTKFLFNKYGFESIMSNESYPSDLKIDACKALRASVVNHKSLFKTRLELELRDCSNELVYKSEIGESREKDYDRAYNLALRDAFKSIENLNYKYSAKEIARKSVIVASEEDDSEVERLKAKIEKLESESKTVKEIEMPKKAETKVIEPEITEVKETIAEKKEEQPNNVKASNNVFYAQVIDGGYQIVDSTPKVVMKLYSTGKQNTFIVEDQNAIVYEEDGFWYISEREGSTTSTRVLNIKF